jgi:Tfp pilus assembly protein PilN
MIPTQSLNLLPPKNRARIGYERLSRFFTLFYTGIAIILLIGIILLLPTYFFLFFQNRGISELISAISQSSESTQALMTEQLIQTTNEKLDRLKQEHSLTPSLLTQYMRDITNRAPATIVLTRLTYQKENNQIQLSGNADTRDDLLVFIQELRKNQQFTNVESPVENILQEHDISFSLSFSLISEVTEQ